MSKKEIDTLVVLSNENQRLEQLLIQIQSLSDPGFLGLLVMSDGSHLKLSLNCIHKLAKQWKPE